MEDIRPMLGESAGACRTREHSSRVEHANLVKWPAGFRKRYRVGIADSLNLDDWQPCERATLRVRSPLFGAACHSTAEPSFRQGILKVSGSPSLDGSGDRLCAVLATEEGEYSLLQTGKVCL